jgi:hypothetical protein
VKAKDYAMRDFRDLDNAVGQLKRGAFIFDKIHLNDTGSKYVGELIASSLAPIINRSTIAPEAAEEALPRGTQ